MCTITMLEDNDAAIFNEDMMIEPDDQGRKRRRDADNDQEELQAEFDSRGEMYVCHETRGANVEFVSSSSYNHSYIRPIPNRFARVRIHRDIDCIRGGRKRHGEETAGT